MGFAQKKSRIGELPKRPTETQLKRRFEEETGKKAVWRGKETKGYSEWKKSQ